MVIRMAATVLGQFVAEPSGWPFFIFHFSLFIRESELADDLVLVGVIVDEDFAAALH